MGLLSCFRCFGPPASKDATGYSEQQAGQQHLWQSPWDGTQASARAQTINAPLDGHGHNDVSEQFYSPHSHSISSEAFGSCRGSFSSLASNSVRASDSLELVVHAHGPHAAEHRTVANHKHVVHANHVPSSRPAQTSQGSTDPTASPITQDLYDAAALYERHPCRAYHVVLQYCEQRGTTPKALAESLPAPSDLPGYTLRRLLVTAAALELGISSILDHSGWTLVRDDSALSMWYRHTKHTTVHHFKAQCLLETPFEHIIAVVREFDLAKTWNNYVVEANILHQHSPAEMLCQGVMWMPWPLNNMELLVEAAGCDLLDSHGALMVTMQRPDVAIPGIKPPSKKLNALKMLPGSCMHLQPLLPAKPGAPMRVKATIQAHMDFGIKYIPGFVISFFLKVLSPYMYNQVVKLLDVSFKDENDPLPTRMREHAAFYAHVRARTAAHLEKQRGKTGQAGHAEPFAPPTPKVAAG